jgi:hypothetical protein
MSYISWLVVAGARFFGLMLLLFSSVSCVDKVFLARLACYFSSMLRIVMNILALKTREKLCQTHETKK